MGQPYEQNKVVNVQYIDNALILVPSGVPSGVAVVQEVKKVVQ